MSTFEERLAEMRASAILPEAGLFRYQHVERLGNEEVEGLLDGEVIVQTKIDGANLTVAWYPDPIGLVVASRNNVVYRNGAPVEFPKGEGKTEKRFMDAIEYVLAHDGIRTMAAQGFVLRGEWMIQHSIVYAKEHSGHFIVFDVERHDGSYVHPDAWMLLAQEHAVRFVPVLARLISPRVDALVELTKGADEFGAQQKEGIVVKRYEFTNKRGRRTWGKIVSADFKLKNKVAMGATNDDPAEIRFVSEVISYALIMKTIHKLEEDKGQKLEIRDMPQVLGRVWHDAFTEELWDFVKNEKVGKFDFRLARRLAEGKTRDIALAYFNGIPTVHENKREESNGEIQP
jgi:hypothetical protein